MISFGQKLLAAGVVAGLNLFLFSLSISIGSRLLLFVAVLFAATSSAFVLRVLAV